MENDRVLGDLWGQSNVPVVLNNPYSEAQQVRAHGSMLLQVEMWVWGDGTRPSEFSHHRDPLRSTGGV